ncbi:MAG: hypothetical protein ABIK42_06975, partial [candidate division WOR-3 bacterium]
MRRLALLMIVMVLGLGANSLYVGRVDTIGGTTYDWQLQGPAKRTLANAPEYGLHTVWMYSATEYPFSDRNIRYNFYNYLTRTWHWIEPDFISSGINVFTERAGFGNVQTDPNSGRAVIVAHISSGGSIRPVLVRDYEPGAGIFEFCLGPVGYLWPVLAVGETGWAHIAMMEDATRNGIFYSRVVVWCRWDDPMLMSYSGDPSFNIAASPASNKVIVSWVKIATPVDSLYYRLSTDGGASWSDPIALEPPPAYGGDTLTLFSLFGPFPYFDRNDQLHFVADIIPVINDTMYLVPAGIWHWCETNNPQWSLVRRAGCAPENLRGALGHNASYVSHPSIGEDNNGKLYVAWEEFDSSNVEPLTGLLRSNIWLAASNDNGQTWGEALQLTPSNTVSHRFPCVVDLIIGGGANGDTVVVMYLMDSIAGFYVLDQGPMSYNPIVCQFVPVSLLGMVGIKEASSVKRQGAICATVISKVICLQSQPFNRSERFVLLDAL